MYNVFRRGPSSKVYNTAAVSKKCVLTMLELVHDCLSYIYCVGVLVFCDLF